MAKSGLAVLGGREFAQSGGNVEKAETLARASQLECLAKVKR
jgi:hypothetical protein